MRRRPLILGVLIGCAPLLSSCSHAYDAQVTGSLERPVLTFVEHGETRPRRVCIDTVIVYDVAAAETGPIWDVGHVNADCVTVSAVGYGETLPGLPVNRQAQSLKPDTIYEFSGGGRTTDFPRVSWGSGGRGARVIFHDGAWRPADR